jgi:hypothetical protein
LSKTTSFLVNQTAQHKAVAAVNNNKFRLFPPNLDHVLKKSLILLGGEIPNKMCTAHHKNLAYKQFKKDVELFLESDRSNTSCHHSSSVEQDYL